MSAARNRYKRAILLLRADRTAQTTENTKHAAASKRIIPASKGIPAAPAAPPHTRQTTILTPQTRETTQFSAGIHACPYCERLPQKPQGQSISSPHSDNRKAIIKTVSSAPYHHSRHSKLETGRKTTPKTGQKMQAMKPAVKEWSGRQDSNLRHPAPKADITLKEN